MKKEKKKNNIFIYLVLLLLVMPLGLSFSLSDFFSPLSITYAKDVGDDYDNAQETCSNRDGYVKGTNYYHDCSVKFANYDYDGDSEYWCLCKKDSIDNYEEQVEDIEDEEESSTSKITSRVAFRSVDVDYNKNTDEFDIEGVAEVISGGSFIIEVGYVDSSIWNSLATFDVKADNSVCDSNQFFASTQGSYKKGDIINFEYSINAPQTSGEYVLKLYTANGCYDDIGSSQVLLDVFKITFNYQKEVYEETSISYNEDKSTDLVDYDSNSEEISEDVEVSSVIYTNEEDPNEVSSSSNNTGLIIVVIVGLVVLLKLFKVF